MQLLRYRLILSIFLGYSLFALPIVFASPLGNCAAIRGNGHYLLAHFGSLARLTEMSPNAGGFDAVAGGSSASITAFIYQSIKLNPLIQNCGTSPCSASQKSARIALMLKSIMGYGQILAGSDEVAALTRLAALAKKVQSKIEASGPTLPELLQTRKDILFLLSSPDIRDLINPSVVTKLSDNAHIKENLNDLLISTQNLASFKVQDNTVFFREALLNFDQISRKIGRIGSYYAGYAPTDLKLQESFLDLCSESTKNLNWTQASVRPATDQLTCGQLFFRSLTQFRSTLLQNEAQYYSRIQDPIDKGIPAVVSTSIMAGPVAFNKYAQAAATFAQTHTALNLQQFNPQYQDIQFGYWSSNQNLAAIAQNINHYIDPKTSKFYALGSTSWYHILRTSPAEPGLSTARVLIPGVLVSFGGWSDLHPTLVLKNLGCSNITYITRKGQESDFLKGVVKQLGFDQTQIDDLYRLQGGESSFLLSLNQSNHVWCTDWNSHANTEFAQMFDQSYLPGQLLDPNLQNQPPIAGCTTF